MKNKLLIIIITLFLFPIISRAVDCTGYDFMIGNKCVTDGGFYDDNSIYHQLPNNNGATIKIMHNFDTLDIVYKHGDTDKTYTFTLDLNGHSVHLLKLHGNSDDDLMNITVVDSSSSKTSYVDELEIGYWKENGGTSDPDKVRVNATIDNILINDNIYIKPDGTGTFKNIKTIEYGRNISHLDSIFIWNYGRCNINSGSYTNSKRIYNANKMNINGGTFDGMQIINSYTSYLDTNYILNVKGGTFYANQADSDDFLFKNSGNSSSNVSRVALNFSGGTFKSKQDNLFYNKYGTVSVSNVTTTASDFKYTLFNSEDGTVNLTNVNLATSVNSSPAFKGTNSLINFESGTISAESSTGTSFGRMVFGLNSSSVSPKTANPKLYLNNESITGSLDWKSGIIYTKIDDLKNNEDITIPTNYQIRSKAQANNLVISYLAATSDPDSYFPSGITDTGEGGATTYKAGDWNNDGVVDSVDLANYRKYIAGNAEVVNNYNVNITEEHRKALDMNDDKAIGLVDLVKVRAIAAN